MAETLAPGGCSNPRRPMFVYDNPMSHDWVWIVLAFDCPPATNILTVADGGLGRSAGKAKSVKHSAFEATIHSVPESRSWTHERFHTAENTDSHCSYTRHDAIPMHSQSNAMHLCRRNITLEKDATFDQQIQPSISCAPEVNTAAVSAPHRKQCTRCTVSSG